MDLIDEEDDATLGLRHLVDHAFQTLLKLTLILRSSHQCTHIERVELLVLQVLWYVATHDTSCQTLNDSGLTCTRFTNQNRVVLCSTTQNLQQPSDLIITTNHWVELTLACEVYQVFGILFEALIVLIS